MNEYFMRGREIIVDGKPAVFHEYMNMKRTAATVQMGTVAQPVGGLICVMAQQLEDENAEAVHEYNEQEKIRRRCRRKRGDSGAWLFPELEKAK